MGTQTLLESRQGRRRETFQEKNSSAKMHSNRAGCEQWGPTFVKKWQCHLGYRRQSGTPGGSKNTGKMYTLSKVVQEISKFYFGKKNHGRNRNVLEEAMNAFIKKVQGSEVQEENKPPHYVKQK